MGKSSIEKGTIKVAWIGKSNKKLYSKMFNSVEDAMNFSKRKKDFLIFKLLKRKKMVEFEWELLDYGRFNEFDKLVKLHRNYKIGKLLG
jgi:hypothetical protein